MSRAEKIARANRALELLDDDVLKSAFERIISDHMEKFLAADHTDDALRRACQDRINAIKDVRQRLRSIVTDGKEAALHNEEA